MPGLDIPPHIVGFLKKPNAAVIACVRPDGFPMSVATWYDWEDGRILVNMHKSRARLGWMRLNPKVSLTMFDGDWYRHVSIYGLVVTITDDVDLSDVDRLSRRYTGRRFGRRTDKRVSAWIERRAGTRGNSRTSGLRIDSPQVKATAGPRPALARRPT